MPMLLMFKNALKILMKGDWKEFYFRLLIFFKKIDLDFCSQEDMHLPAERCYDYSDSGGLYLERVLSVLNVKKGDAIIDFGSGKGGALFTFSKYPFTRIAGCEISSELALIAKKNLAKMKIKNIDIVISDAAEVRDIDGFNYFYFFNPFPCSVMKKVIRNIVNSLKRNKRNVIIIYCNPECHETILSENIFFKILDMEQGVLKYNIYSNRF